VRVETIGNATLYLGDCLEILPTLVPGVAELVLTDPPYSSPVVTGFGRSVERDYYGGLSMQRTYLKFLAKELERLVPARVMVFCDEDYYPVLHEALYHWPSRQMAVWDKGRIGLGNGFRKQHELIIHAATDGCDLHTWGGKGSHSSILRFTPVGREDRDHGAQKPLDLITYLVRAGSRLGAVLDPFMGSGTTGIACGHLGRKFIGIEIEPKYFDKACERIENAQRQQTLFESDAAAAVTTELLLEHDEAPSV
jgi:site-specific DNA-methyltransferase (adenine-specific)